MRKLRHQVDIYKKLIFTLSLYIFPVFACISTGNMTVACLWKSVFSGIFYLCFQLLPNLLSLHLGMTPAGLSGFQKQSKLE